MISYCCFCCPQPVQGLLNLWIRSGFSKSTVAAALTFFPPSPALYKFERYDQNLHILPDYEEELALEVDGRDGNNDENMEKTEDEKPNNTMTALFEKNKKLQHRANKRYENDKLDDKNGILYRFIPDPRLRPAPNFSGRIEALKIHSPKSKSYLATLVYHVKADKKNRKFAKTIIYSHGNATDIGAMNLVQCLMSRGLGVNVIVYDYSGYGESGGVTLEKNTYNDLEAVYLYAVEHLAGGMPENIILYGQSVGSGPTCYIGSKKPAGGIILHSPFMSGMRVLTPNRALACLDIYPNIDRIKKIKCPVFIIHGMVDEEVGPHHGLGLYDAIRKEYRFPPWWIPDRGHNDICEGRGRMSEYIRRLKQFLASLDEVDESETNFEKGKVQSMQR